MGIKSSGFFGLYDIPGAVNFRLPKQVLARLFLLFFTLPRNPDTLGPGELPTMMPCNFLNEFVGNGSLTFLSIYPLI